MGRVLWIMLVVLALSAPLVGQTDDEQVTLPDRVMKQVVRRIVNQFFKPRRRSETVYFSDANLKKEWLPKIRGIRFVLLRENEGHYGQKGYVIDYLERTKNGYSIGLGYGEIGCSGGGYGVTLFFRIVASRVRFSGRRGRWGWNCDADAAPIS